MSNRADRGQRNARQGARRAGVAGSQGGQGFVLVTLFLVTLVALVGLGVDGGILYLNRRAMQNAADAGAFAGARLLAKPTPNRNTACVRAEIEKFALKNYVVNRSDVTACYTPDTDPDA